MREEHKCDLIIALNHMRKPEDLDMAEKCGYPILDMEFGGHDHSYFTFLNSTTDVFICKSGSDFECFTNLSVYFGVDQNNAQLFIDNHKENVDFNIHYSPKLQRLFVAEKVIVDEKFEPDSEVLQHVEKYTAALNEQLDKDAGYTWCNFEARFSRVRTEETNLGNWCTDLMRSELNTDFAISNGGSFRANSVF